MAVVKFTPRARPDTVRGPDYTSTYESATAEVIAHRSRSEHRTLYVLVTMLVLIAVFITVTRVDRIVQAEGRVVPVTGTLTVQPLEKAIISRVLVAVGDVVKKGQVLATCDPTFARADLLEYQEKYATLDAQRRRQEAEIAGQPFVPASAAPYESLQLSIWKQRQTEFSSGVSDFDQRIRSTEAQLVGLKQNIADYKSRVKIANEVAGMYASVEEKGYVSHLQLLTADDQRVEMTRNLTSNENLLEVTTHLLGSLAEQRKVFIDKWHDDTLNDLVNTKSLLGETGQLLTKAKKLSELVDLIAPEDSVVVTVPQLRTGGVATDAQPLFSLMPLNAPIEVAVQINPQDVGFVRTGDTAVIKFSAFKFLEHGVAEGVVRTIGEDTRMTDSGSDLVTAAQPGTQRSPYYEARIRITTLKFHDVPSDFRLMPGMTLMADIVVGHRTIMWYLLGGALRSGSEAMHEP
jgi:membrane fusion protein, hemolysin D